MYIEKYEAKDGFRWRIVENDRIVADSGEAYATKSSLTRAINSFLKAICDEVFIHDETKSASKETQRN